MHIYQMYKWNNILINTSDFWFLLNHNVGGLQHFMHLGYHVHDPEMNKTICCFFTSKPKVKYNGVDELIHNIDVNLLNEDFQKNKFIKYVNHPMMFDTSTFIQMFGIINDPNKLPKSLVNLPIETLHNECWNAYKTTIHSTDSKWYKYEEKIFKEFDLLDEKERIKKEISNLEFTNHHSNAITRFENKYGLQENYSLTNKSTKHAKIIF